MSANASHVTLASLDQTLGRPGYLESAKSRADSYYQSGHRAPYEEVTTLAGQGGKVSTKLSLSFWPNEDPKLNLLLQRNTGLSNCDTVSAVVAVTDPNQTSFLGVENLWRPTGARSFEPVASKIEFGKPTSKHFDSTHKTYQEECAQEIGLLPGAPFDSFKFLSHGVPAQKAWMSTCARNAAVEGGLRTSEPFDRSQMSATEPSDTELLVLRQWHCPAEGLSTMVNDKRSQGVHIDSNIGPLAVKMDQIKGVLTHDPQDPKRSIIDALDIHRRQVSQRQSLDSSVPHIGPPGRVTIRNDDLAYSTGTEGTQIRNVGLHYANQGGKGTYKEYPLSMGHPPETAVAAIISRNDEPHVVFSEHWRPGGGNGNQSSAWCLDFPRGPYKPNCSGRDVGDIMSNYLNGKGFSVHMLSDSGIMDKDAGLSDDRHSFVEASVVPSGSFCEEGCDKSVRFVPLDRIQDTIQEYSANGGDVSLLVDSFATKIPQIQNAIAYKDPRITNGSRHWSHALPEVLNLNPPLTREAKAIEDSFSR